MVRRLPLLGAIACMALAGCSSQPASEQPPPEIKPKLDLTLGVYSDGVVFMEWNDGLYHLFQCLGNLSAEKGAEVKLQLKEYEDDLSKLRDILSLDANLKVTGDETFVISGTYVSSEAFRLEILGSTEDEKDHHVLSFEAGEGEIDYTGEAPFTYARPEQP